MYDLICFAPLALAILALWFLQSKVSTDFPEVTIQAPDGTTETAFISATHNGRSIFVDSDAKYIGTGLPDGTIHNRPGYSWDYTC